MEINRKIYAFWLNGDESTLTPNRKAGLETMKANFGVLVHLVTAVDLPRYILPEAPLHEGFKYLCRVHQSDYLRCYFLHFYGGGYSDIKFYGPKSNWVQCFDMMDADPGIQVIGKKEIKGGSPYAEWKYSEKEYSKLLANGWFICRPRSEFTSKWYAELLRRMDAYLPRLKARPADHADRRGGGGRGYPIWWPSLLGHIVHKIEHDMPESAKRNCLVVDRIYNDYI